MNIARHWCKAEATATLRNGSAWRVERWGWSDLSEADARTNAERGAAELAGRVAGKGGWPDRHYEYAMAGRPLREELVSEHRGDDGRALIAITRNSYGALVLNAAEAMFIDIDGPEQKPGRSGGGFLAGLFGKKPAPAAPAEPRELQVVRSWAQAHQDWSLRVYKTKAGLRVLVTHAPMPPESDAVLGAMRELNADPLYVRLCRAQKCFRARLTPKPWRIDIQARPPRFPCDGRANEMARWKGDYDRRSEAFATCSLLAELGPRIIHPALAAVVQLHDAATKTASGLPLA